MKPEIVLAYEFVQFIPDEVKERTLYISITYCTAVHKCCCGCGREVVTPLSPTAWKLTFDGRAVSLYPSIGSWSLPCQSHYFITQNRVVLAPKWTKKQIERGRAQEAREKERYYPREEAPLAVAGSVSPTTSDKPAERRRKMIKKRRSATNPDAPRLL